jgi:hypothetical protein
MPTSPSPTKSAANRPEPVTAQQRKDYAQDRATSVANQAKPMPTTSEAVPTKPAAPSAATTIGTMVDYVKVRLLLSTSMQVTDEVPEWEVPVLQNIHGEQSVVVLSSRKRSYPYNAAQALQYMKNKYAKAMKDGDPVKDAYKTAKVLAKETGLPYSPGDEAAAKFTGAQTIFHDEDEQGAAGSGASGKAAA